VAAELDGQGSGLDRRSGDVLWSLLLEGREHVLMGVNDLNLCEEAAQQLSHAIETEGTRDEEIAQLAERRNELGKADRSARQLHRAYGEMLKTLSQSPNQGQLPTLAQLLGDRLIQILKCLTLYCPIHERFFETVEKRRQHFEKLGFEPRPGLQGIHHGVVVRVQQEIEELLPSLLPSEDFAEKREALRARLENLLVESGGVPPGSRLIIFGSSANNFGRDTSDMDMCVFTPGPIDDRSELVRSISRALEASEDVIELNLRDTARIPIVMFKDSVTGIDCDISCGNALAVRNTALLRTYSHCDPRVRALAYILKLWTTRRHINDPSKATLSSYGYLMTIIVFLQTRKPPILSNLQQLPPDWPNSKSGAKPQLLVLHDTKDLECDTYFHTPPNDDFSQLRRFGAANQASVAALLLSYFHFYAYEVDYEKTCVSIRAGGLLRKDLKAEESGWHQHAVLSIEDPFETFYDVAHVVKHSRHLHIRAEMARAVSIAQRARGEEPSGVLAEILAEAPLPPWYREEKMAHNA